jgi:hypothetical protein
MAASAGKKATAPAATPVGAVATRMAFFTPSNRKEPVS